MQCFLCSFEFPLIVFNWPNPSKGLDQNQISIKSAAQTFPSGSQRSLELCVLLQRLLKMQVFSKFNTYTRVHRNPDLHTH